MLKLFFDRFSKIVYFLEILGIVFSIGWITKLLQNPISLGVKIGLALYFFEYLFLRFCATWHWYPRTKRYLGIELQFKKAMIPTSYLLAIASGAGYFWGSTGMVWVAVFLMTLIAHVNVILLTLHFQDSSTTPVNYYSSSKT